MGKVHTENVFSASARSASYLILLQLFTRLLTFTFNQLILRHTPPATFGFATIQLELLSSTVLFLSREGFRIALQRDQEAIQRSINLAFIPSGLGVVGSFLGCWILWRAADQQTKQLGGFGASIVLYGVATVLELLGEPAFVVAQKLHLFRLRTIGEGAAVVSRCAVTYYVTTTLARRGTLDEVGAIPFGLGQLAYAVVLTGFLTFFVSIQRNLLPNPLSSDGVNKGKRYLFHQPTLVLAFSIIGQSLFKHLLTEGDKFVLTMLTTPYTQGIYAIVSNYGSLIARILFQPVEEALRTILSPLLAKPGPSALRRTSGLITTLLRLYLFLTLVIHAVIPSILTPVAVPVLEALIGKDRFPASALLPILYAYLYYIPLMAINGILESFVASVATPTDLARQSRAMLLFSLIFLSSSWVFFAKMGMGGEGLVWANCINMTARIVWSCVFMMRWFAESKGRLDWTDAIPKNGSKIISFLVGWGMKWAQPAGFREALITGLVGGITLFVSMVCLELDFFKDAYAMMMDGPRASKDK